MSNLVTFVHAVAGSTYITPAGKVCTFGGPRGGRGYYVTDDASEIAQLRKLSKNPQVQIAIVEESNSLDLAAEAVRREQEEANKRIAAAGAVSTIGSTPQGGVVVQDLQPGTAIGTPVKPLDPSVSQAMDGVREGAIISTTEDAKAPAVASAQDSLKALLAGKQ